MVFARCIVDSVDETLLQLIVTFLSNKKQSTSQATALNVGVDVNSAINDWL